MTSPEDNPSPKEVLEEIKTTTRTLEALPARLQRLERQGSKLVLGIIGVLALIFGLVCFFLWNESRNNGNQNDKFDDFAHCQAQYNEVNTKVSATRAELNSQLNSAQAKRDAKIAKIVGSGAGDINKVFADYTAELARIETARQLNPLPAYPDCYDKYIKETETLTPLEDAN